MKVADFFALSVERQVELARLAGERALERYELPRGARLELLNHRENTVFAVTVAGARRGALRVHRTGYQTEASILSELEWMRALDAAGVRTPKVVPAADGAWVVSVRIDELAEPRLCDLLEWIEGRPPEGADLVASFRFLGELHARCHAHASGWSPPAGFTRQAWDETALLDARHPVIAPPWENWALGASQRELISTCREALRARLRHWGKGPERWGLIHADLMPENLIVAADGVRLIDFDDCGFGWFLYDPASALLYYCAQDIYPDLLEAWAAGYRTVRALDDEALAELPTFLMLRCFYALGWLQARRDSEAAAMFGEPLAALSEVVGREFLRRRG